MPSVCGATSVPILSSESVAVGHKRFINKGIGPKKVLSRKSVLEAEKNRFEMVYLQMAENQNHKEKDDFLLKKKR